MENTNGVLPEDIFTVFARLGFPKYEARVYATLSACGKLKMGKLAKYSSVPQSRIYEVTASLEEKGAVTVSRDFPATAESVPLKQIVSWMGLCPSLHQSGNSTYMGRMKKDSNKRVRSILIQAAETASIHDPRMKSLYDRCAARHGHNKAIVRVANKMASITWHILTKKDPYQQAKDRLYASKLKNLTRVAA